MNTQKDGLNSEQSAGETKDITINEVISDDQKLQITERSKHGKLMVILICIFVLIVSIIVVASKWNIIMGYQNCKSGNYESAIKYYGQQINSGKYDDVILTRYNALTAYILAKNAYSSDNMEEMSENIAILNKTSSSYPTKSEIQEVQLKYKTRSGELNEYNKSIGEIEAMFADIVKIDTIKKQCDELLKKNVSAMQKNKIVEIKKVADDYIMVKGIYDDKNYEEVIQKISGMGKTYQAYEIKKEIDKMKDEAQKVLDERELIKTTLQSAHASLDDGKFESSLSMANELLEMNLTEEQRTEVEQIKSASEQKVAEEKAAAEKAEKEARQKMLDEAIKVTASDLYNSFTTNLVGAENKYKNKVLLVSGTVYSINKTWIFGTPYVELKAGYVADGVTAYFTSSTSSQLTNLSQGQTVKILGKCGGRSLGIVTLNDCSVVD